MQQLFIAGNIGKDAELRTTNSGDKVAGFSVAVSNGKDSNGNWRDSTWFDCSLWGKRAEALSQYLTKGTRVAVSGRPTAREHNDKVYLGLSVNEITMLGGGQSGGSQGGGYNQEPQAPAGGAPDYGDEIPFAAEWRA